MKKVSVILTTFNSSKFIRRTLDSILGQRGFGSDFDLELIIVDDCSTDNTLEIIQNYGINYLSTETNSGGPNRGRNIGIKAATGDYICITDHDDEWYEDRIIQLLPYLEIVPIVTSGYKLIDKTEGAEKEIYRQKKGTYIFYDENVSFKTILAKSQKGQNLYLGGLIYNSQLNNILFEENFGLIDFDWIVRLLYQNASIELCKALYIRYVDGKNLSLNEKYRVIDYNFSLQFIQKYRIEYPLEYKKAYQRINGTMAKYYYVTGNMKKARSFFVKSGFCWKTVAYYITTFIGSELVIKKFRVFG